MHPFGRRRRYLVHKKMQFKYAILTMALLVLYTVVLLAAVVVPPIVIFASQDIPLGARAEAANAFLLINRYMWPGIAAVILLFGVISIFITHKVAGPLFVIERMLNQIADGNLSARMRLRKGDDLKEFEQTMNRMAENLESSLARVNERFNNVALLAREMSPGQSSEKQSMLLAEVEEVGKILGHFTLRKKGRKTD